MIKVIKGNRIVLRPATPVDRRKIFEWLAQSDTTSKFIGPPDFEDNPVPSWEDFLSDYDPQFFNDLCPENGRSFIIEVNGTKAGHINYNEIDRSTGTVELDIWMAGSAYCNRGYGTDAIETLCKYMADNMNCHRFILAPSARNTSAIRAYEKCGFSRSNELPRNFIPDYYDTVIMIKHL